MFDFFNEIILARFNEYSELLDSCPIWFLWVYFGLLAAALVYSIFFSKTLNRALWLVFSLTFPLVAFPIEIIQHIITVKVLRTFYNERRGDKTSHKSRVRLRFVIVPAAGALFFAIMGGFFGNNLPVSVRQFFGMVDYRVPWTLSGAALFLTVLFIASYRSRRMQIRYFRITPEGGFRRTPTGQELYGHKIYNMFEPSVPENRVDAIISTYFEGNLEPQMIRFGSMPFRADNMKYDVSVLTPAEFNYIKDIETVSRIKTTTGYRIDRVAYIDWEIAKDGKFSGTACGYRNILWRSSPRLYTLMFEALTSVALIWSVLTPGALNIHIEILKAVVGLFNK